MTNDQLKLLALAADLRINPGEVENAIALMRTGRSDLLNAVLSRRITISEALKTARASVIKQQEVKL
jgi:hypothetical protein